MEKRRSVVEKVLWGAGVAVAFVGLSFLLVPQIPALRSVLQSGEEQNPVVLTNWMVKMAADDLPDGLWNGMGSKSREKFRAAFDKVRDGSVPTTDWATAGEISAAKLKKLDDRHMFRVWWRLKDKTVVGFRIPAFLAIGGDSIESFVYEKVLYDTRPPETAAEGYVYYKVNGTADLLHFLRDDGRWRLDLQDTLPPGI